MNIVNFTPEYLELMAGIFVEEYSEPGRVWNIVTAKKYLARNLERDPQFCKVVVNNNEFLGAICCRTDPYYQGTLLFIDSLEIDKKYRKKGVATLLLKYIVEMAKKEKLDGIHFLGDIRKGFPRDWYYRLGFIESGWTEYELLFKLS